MNHGMSIAPLLVSAFSALLGFASHSFAQVLNMPHELVQFASAKGCSQVDDFFARPGMVNPPFVYGYAQGDEEDSAVFWCEKRVSGKRGYVLQLMYRKGPQELRCEWHIEWSSFPGGLSLVRNPQLPSDSFVYLDDRKSSPKQGTRLTGTAILSTYDGASTWFYCYQGRWLVRQTH